MPKLLFRSAPKATARVDVRDGLDPLPKLDDPLADLGDLEGFDHAEVPGLETWKGLLGDTHSHRVRLAAAFSVHHYRVGTRWSEARPAIQQSAANHGVLRDLHAYIDTLSSKEEAAPYVTAANELGKLTRTTLAFDRLNAGFADAKKIVDREGYEGARGGVDFIARMHHAVLHQRLKTDGVVYMPGAWARNGTGGHAAILELRHDDQGDRAYVYDTGAGAVDVQSADDDQTRAKPRVESRSTYHFEDGALVGRRGADLLRLAQRIQLEGSGALTKDHVDRAVPMGDLIQMHDGRHQPTAQTAKRQTVGNCGHKSTMRFLKNRLSDAQYIAFKNEMRGKLLGAYKQRFGNQHELYIHAKAKHRAWQAKHGIAKKRSRFWPFRR